MYFQLSLCCHSSEESAETEPAPEELAEKPVVAAAEEPTAPEQAAAENTTGTVYIDFPHSQRDAPLSSWELASIAIRGNTRTFDSWTRP